jgi:hypothetical protein
MHKKEDTWMAGVASITLCPTAFVAAIVGWEDLDQALCPELALLPSSHRLNDPSFDLPHRQRLLVPYCCGAVMLTPGAVELAMVGVIVPHPLHVWSVLWQLSI